MKNSTVKTVWKSLLFYRQQALYQFVVVMLLAAIITGSLLTGNSVRNSLRVNNIDRIGNSGMVISSGERYFPASLAGKLKEVTGKPVVAITELHGWSRNFAEGQTALNCQVTGVNNDFFTFHNPLSAITIERGEAVINSKLASRLSLREGDEIMVRFGSISDIPADSPFSAEESSFESLVLVVSYIIDDESPANFSLSVNQIKPENIFIHINDLESFFGGAVKSNRLLTLYDPALTTVQLAANLAEIMAPEDIGLVLNMATAAGQYELISDRIFIDDEVVKLVTGKVPGAEPVITYLANEIRASGRTTPYSFVSALPGQLYEEMPAGDGIIINNWLADDLGIKVGDTLQLSYYISAPLNKLEESYHKFVVERVVEIKGIWGDPDLMPRFPGISGKESCSRWDAGVPVKMDEIRQKDEDYWYAYGGTPKVFVNYETGKELWGNNFGPATAIRFPSGTHKDDIYQLLNGQIDPLKNGFRITDARENAISAASNSVDFSTLFLSLGFFIIISSLLLLSLIVSTFFESRKGHISTMRALGFSRKLIRKILFLETAATAVTGGLAGIAAGSLFNLGVIRALNSVWRGAVQTDTLSASFDPPTMAAGLAVTLIVTMAVLYYKSNRLLGEKTKGKTFHIRRLPGGNIIYPVVAFVMAISSIAAGIVKQDLATALFFAGGTLLFAAFLIMGFTILLERGKKTGLINRRQSSHSWIFYGRYPSRAITPVLFIAAGLFIVISTGANRKSFDTHLLSRESGTGGYLLWGETATPLAYDLNSSEGREQYGIDDSDLPGALFIQGMVARGDDASCLNLNQVSTPPILGIDAATFSKAGAFTFAASLNGPGEENPWDMLENNPGENTIYGIMDQTVLQWGLKRKVGDTLTMSTEWGEPLHIIISGGLASSIFQGYIIVDRKNFTKYMPSVSGSNIFLVDGESESAGEYREILTGIFGPYGTEIEYTWDRLAEFNQVSNTYLTVFMTLGGFGMLLGVTGLAFILLRNFNLRKKEFALLLAAGYTPDKLRRLIFREHLAILVAGIIAGTIPAIIATTPSITSGSDIPLLLIITMVLAIFASGFTAVLLSSRSLVKDNLVLALRSD